MIKYKLQRYILEALFNPKDKANFRGFTLAELLVVVVMSSVVLIALMGFIVEMVQTDERESATTETQREMQMAMNYIIQDVSEAVYIYDGRCNPNDATSCPSYRNFISNAGILGNASSLDVLAFWKARPLNQTQENVIDQIALAANPCQGANTNITDITGPTACRNVLRARQQFSLVVYLQVPNTVNNPNGLWEGESRVVRYELPAYQTAGFTAGPPANIAFTPGYVNPYRGGDRLLRNWPFDENGTNRQNAQWPGLAAVEGTANVLVDFVDSGATTAAEFDCPANYAKMPRDATTDTTLTPVSSTISQGFYTCIRDVATFDGGTAIDRPGQVQDVIISLRGNPDGRTGAPITGRLPALEGRVTMRGIIDR